MKSATRKPSPAVQVPDDELLPEYDLSKMHMRPNKFAARYAAGSNIVMLDPDVAAVFPTASEVNEALRALAVIIKKRRPRRAAPPSRPAEA